MNESRPDSERKEQSDNGMQAIDSLAAKMVEEMDGERQAVREAEEPSPWRVAAKRVAVPALVLVILGSWLYVFSHYRKMSGGGFEAPNASAAEEVVRQILVAQAAYREGGYRDANGDGVAEYGELHELADKTASTSLRGVLRSREGHGYVFTVVLRDSTPERGPGFTVIASPLDASERARTILADEGGNMRFKEGGALGQAHDIAVE